MEPGRAEQDLGIALFQGGLLGPEGMGAIRGWPPEVEAVLRRVVDLFEAGADRFDAQAPGGIDQLEADLLAQMPAIEVRIRAARDEEAGS
jgi:hypothetical protein